MLRIFSILVLFTLSVTAETLPSNKSRTSPTPEGDSRIGSDAAASGTNIEDDGSQDQGSSERLPVQEKKSPHKKNELEKEQNLIKTN